METEPKFELLKDFFLPDLGTENPNLLQKIKQAWTQIHRKGKELGKRDCRAKETYHQWVVQRVKEIKLPYNTDVQRGSRMSFLHHTSSLEKEVSQS